MILCILAFSLILIGLGILVAYLGRYYCSYDRKTEWDWNVGSILLIVIGSFATLISFIVIFCLIGTLVSLKPINNKITYLEQNNAIIEEKLYVALENYCEHENKTLVEISPDNPEVIFLIYPELKANELFESYINTLVENNNEIKQLNLKKINEPIYKWWLYFGG